MKLERQRTSYLSGLLTIPTVSTSFALVNVVFALNVGGSLRLCSYCRTLQI